MPSTMGNLKIDAVATSVLMTGFKFVDKMAN